MRKLKVYHGCLNGMDAILVAAHSKKEAAKLCGGVSYHYFNKYMSETENAEYISWALANPYIAFTRQRLLIDLMKNVYHKNDNPWVKLY